MASNCEGHDGSYDTTCTAIAVLNGWGEEEAGLLKASVRVTNSGLRFSAAVANAGCFEKWKCKKCPQLWAPEALSCGTAPVICKVISRPCLCGITVFAPSALSLGSTALSIDSITKEVKASKMTGNVLQTLLPMFPILVLMSACQMSFSSQASLLSDPAGT